MNNLMRDIRKSINDNNFKDKKRNGLIVDYFIENIFDS